MPYTRPDEEKIEETAFILLALLTPEERERISPDTSVNVALLAARTLRRRA